MPYQNCDQCDFRNGSVRKTLRREMFHCSECDRTLCEECLREMAGENELVGFDTPDKGLLTFRCEQSETEMCADCFESDD